MIYLDNGATTYPKPQSVLLSVNRALREYGANPGRSGHAMSIKAAEEIFNCRKSVASLFNVQNIENIIFTLNCTSACNTVLKGTLKKGDHVVVSCLEHNAVMRPLNELTKKGISYTVANFKETDDESIIDAFRQAITGKTKLIVCVHVSNVWGIRMPIERLTALAHIYGIDIMVDAAQSAGVLPIDVTANEIDYLCTAGHKSLYGPMGTGVMIIADSDKVESLTQGGTGSSSLSIEQPSNPPDKFESGTPNLSGIVGLKSGIEFVKSRGVKNILQKETFLAQRLYDKLKNVDGVNLYTPRPDGEKYMPVLSFNLFDKGSEEVSSLLGQNGIYTRGGLHCAPSAHIYMGTEDKGTVRIVPSAFTTREDIDRTALIINRLSNKIKRDM
ncbi:MAG: aminotransferase class V-fold PLP-dependent enzyme [Clostridia bacterium]|nr:aminotransferase class V-fold PLP-dependent enzyme [Clostridia bacterium]